jgi:hypothetical protein
MGRPAGINRWRRRGVMVTPPARRGRQGETNMADPTSGALNPYALAEIILKRRIDWANTPNALQLLATTLGTPADELFDPSFKSLTYAFREPAAAGGLQTRTLTSVSATTKLTEADMTAQLRSNPAVLPKTLGIAHVEKLSPESQALLGSLIGSIFVLPPNLTPWTPPGATWVQENPFFDHGTQYSDPQQGALGDCWLISTLASIAWTRPTVILDHNRPTGTGPQDFLDQIAFPGGTQQVSEKVPMGGSPGNYYYMFARALDGKETWPAIYEKAFARWKSGNLTDEPPYGTLNGNSPIYACQTLIPTLKGTWNATYNQPDSTVENLLAAHCTKQKSTNPMMACTWGSAADAKKYANVTIAYDSSSGIVADHCYSVLGFTEAAGTQYIVLRNPWGYHPGTLDVLTSPNTWSPGPIATNPLVEAVPLNSNGVFAMKTTTFKKYYAGLATFA